MPWRDVGRVPADEILRVAVEVDFRLVDIAEDFGVVGVSEEDDGGEPGREVRVVGCHEGGGFVGDLSFNEIL